MILSLAYIVHCPAASSKYVSARPTPPEVDRRHSPRLQWNCHHCPPEFFVQRGRLLRDSAESRRFVQHLSRVKDLARPRVSWTDMTSTFARTMLGGENLKHV